MKIQRFAFPFRPKSIEGSDKRQITCRSCPLYDCVRTVRDEHLRNSYETDAGGPELAAFTHKHLGGNGEHHHSETMCGTKIPQTLEVARHSIGCHSSQGTVGIECLQEVIG